MESPERTPLTTTSIGRPALVRAPSCVNRLAISSIQRCLVTDEETVTVTGASAMIAVTWPGRRTARPAYLMAAMAPIATAVTVMMRRNMRRVRVMRRSPVSA